MTREEATYLLNNLRSVAEGKEDEAIDMAIEALSILGESGIVNCCGCIHWKSDGGAMMVCDLWDTPMGDFDYCSYGKRGNTE